MSRIGNRILTIPSGVEVSLVDDLVVVKGPKGELSTKLNRNITVEIENGSLTTKRKNDNFKAMHGTTNANILNMIVGVTDGYTKELEAVGVGYRFQVTGNKIVMTVGKSHPVEKIVPTGLTVTSEKNTMLKISGIDKQQVGEFAAVVRKERKPEPYKGKGIRYKDEVIRRKEGKKAA